MEQLGVMEPEQLLQILMGVVGCAAAMIVVTLVYVVLARRSSGTGAKSKRDSLSGPLRNEMPTAPIVGEVARSLWAGESGPPVVPPALDADPRLAGLGGDVWQNQRAEVAPALPASGGKEILRVVQDPSAGKVWIKVADRRYSQLSEVGDRSVGERILTAITYALRFSSGTVATDQGVATIELPPCDAVAVPPPFGTLSEVEEPGEVVRLLSEPERNEFSIQVVGCRYRAIGEVADKAVGQRILEGISYLLQFSRGRLSANGGVRVVPIPALSLRPVAAHAQRPAEAGEPRRVATPEEEDAFFRRQMSQSLPPPDARITRPTLVGSIRGLGKQPTGLLPLLSLAEEIDRILQRKLESSPLAHLDVQLMSSPDGGVRIRVGTQFYDRPGEVPDAELRKIIEASIAEW